MISRTDVGAESRAVIEYLKTLQRYARAMGRSTAVVVALVALACSKAPSPTTKSSSPEAAATAVAKLDGYRVEACACVGLECALRVDDARAAWVVAEHGRFTFTDEQRTAAAAANRAYQVCFDASRETAARRAIRDLVALTDEMCACASAACADEVFARTTALGERQKDTKATDEQMAEATTITERLAACHAAANDATLPRPAPPIDASVPSPPDPSAPQLDGFRARACACADDECVAVVARERHQWFAAALGRDAAPRDAIAAHHQAFDKCSRPRDPSIARFLTVLGDLAAEMCACTTRACAVAIDGKIEAIVVAATDLDKIGDELGLRVRVHGERYNACHERHPSETEARRRRHRARDGDLRPDRGVREAARRDDVISRRRGRGGPGRDRPAATGRDASCRRAAPRR